MPKITYDTSVFIAYQPTDFPVGFVLSAVVLQEMTAGAVDKSDLQRLEAIRRYFEKEDRLLVPDAEDWWQAGRILNALLRGLKSQSGGLTPKLPPQEKHRIVRDVLIARTARKAGATLVTDNLADFEKISRYCKVRLISGTKFFS